MMKRFITFYLLIKDIKDASILQNNKFDKIVSIDY